MGAVNSVLSQDFPRHLYEVIVVKNFRDEFIDSELRELGVTYLCSASKGIGAKVAESLELAEGEAISFLEDDDLFLPGKLEAVNAAFEAGVDYYHSGLSVIDGRGRELAREGGPSYLVSEGDKVRFERFMELNHVWHSASAAAVRRSIIDVRALREVQVSPDLFYFLEALLRGRSLFLDGRPLTAFRVGGSSLGAPSGSESFSSSFARAREAFLKDALFMADLTAGTPYSGLAEGYAAAHRLRLSVARGEAPSADTLRALATYARHFYLGIPPRAYSPVLHRGALVSSLAFHAVLPLAPRWVKGLATSYIRGSLSRLLSTRPQRRAL